MLIKTTKYISPDENIVHENPKVKARTTQQNNKSTNNTRIGTNGALTVGIYPNKNNTFMTQNCIFSPVKRSPCNKCLFAPGPTDRCFVQGRSTSAHEWENVNVRKFLGRDYLSPPGLSWSPRGV